MPRRNPADVAVAATTLLGLPCRPYDARLWHGTTLPVWRSVRDGGRLGLPRDGHRSDPGDFGKAVYLTRNILEARGYARDGTFVRARVRLRHALILDFRRDRAACQAWYHARELAWGSPIHGDVAGFRALESLEPVLDREERRLALHSYPEQGHNSGPCSLWARRRGSLSESRRTRGDRQSQHVRRGHPWSRPGVRGCPGSDVPGPVSRCDRGTRPEPAEICSLTARVCPHRAKWR
jgi:hypothetical protein